MGVCVGVSEVVKVNVSRSHDSGSLLAFGLLSGLFNETDSCLN